MDSLKATTIKAHRLVEGRIKQLTNYGMIKADKTPYPNMTPRFT